MTHLPGYDLILTQGEKLVLVGWVGSAAAAAAWIILNQSPPVPSAPAGVTSSNEGPGQGGAGNPDDDWKNKLKRGLWVVGGFLVVAAAAWYFWPTDGSPPPSPPSTPPPFPPAGGGANPPVDPLAWELHDLTSKLFGADKAIGLPRPPPDGGVTVGVPPGVLPGVTAAVTTAAALTVLTEAATAVSSGLVPPTEEVSALGAAVLEEVSTGAAGGAVSEVLRGADWVANQELLELLRVRNTDVTSIFVSHEPQFTAQMARSGYYPLTSGPAVEVITNQTRMYASALAFNATEDWLGPVLAAGEAHLDHSHAEFLAAAEAAYDVALRTHWDLESNQRAASFLVINPNNPIPDRVWLWSERLARMRPTLVQLGLPEELLRDAYVETLERFRVDPTLIQNGMVDLIRHGMNLDTQAGRYQAYTWFVEQYFDELARLAPRRATVRGVARALTLLGGASPGQPWLAVAPWYAMDEAWLWHNQVGNVQRDWLVDELPRVRALVQGTSPASPNRVVFQVAERGARGMDFVWEVYQALYGVEFARMSETLRGFRAWDEVYPTETHWWNSIVTVTEIYEQAEGRALLALPSRPVDYFREAVDLWQAQEEETMNRIADVRAILADGMTFEHPGQYEARAYNRLRITADTVRRNYLDVLELEAGRAPTWLTSGVHQADWVPDFVSRMEDSELAGRFIQHADENARVITAQRELFTLPEFYEFASQNGREMILTHDQEAFRRAMVEWAVNCRGQLLVIHLQDNPL